MRILAIQNQAEGPLVRIAVSATENGANITIFEGTEYSSLPKNAVSFDGLIILGGYMSAVADDQRPYFPDLLSLIRQYTEDGKPVLGVCLGAQLIARAFGSKPRLSGQFEIGFHRISPTRFCFDDPVLGFLRKPLQLFEWHMDHYDLPPRAVHLASGDNYPYQAYRIGRATYGVQFHFETDRPTVDVWISQATGLSESRPGHESWLPKQFDEFGKGQFAFCHEFIKRWMALART